MQVTPSQKQLQVLVVDGNPLMRFAMLSVINLHPLLRVCEEAGDSRAARELYSRERPNLVVLDIALPNVDGIELLRDFTRFEPNCRYVVVSQICDAGIVQRAFKAGAHAYVSKSDEAAELLCALEAVITNRTYLGKRISRAMQANVSQVSSSRIARLLGSLSDRELHIFHRIGSGQGTTIIAQELGLSVKTVETHKAHIKDKLHLVDAAQLRRAAESWVQSVSLTEHGSFVSD